MNENEYKSMVPLQTSSRRPLIHLIRTRGSLLSLCGRWTFAWNESHEVATCKVCQRIAAREQVLGKATTQGVSHAD